MRDPEYLKSGRDGFPPEWMAPEDKWDSGDYDWQKAFEVAGPPDESESYGADNQPDVRSIPGPDTPLGPFQRKDVETVEAWAEGENDGADWLMVGKLEDGRWFALHAGCDYTGWDCQSGGSVDVSLDHDAIVRYGLTKEEGKRLGYPPVQEKEGHDGW